MEGYLESRLLHTIFFENSNEPNFSTQNRPPALPVGSILTKVLLRHTMSSFSSEPAVLLLSWKKSEKVVVAVFSV